MPITLEVGIVFSGNDCCMLAACGVIWRSWPWGEANTGTEEPSGAIGPATVPDTESSSDFTLILSAPLPSDSSFTPGSKLFKISSMSFEFRFSSGAMVARASASTALPLLSFDSSPVSGFLSSDAAAAATVTDAAFASSFSASSRTSSSMRSSAGLSSFIRLLKMSSPKMSEGRRASSPKRSSSPPPSFSVLVTPF